MPEKSALKFLTQAEFSRHRGVSRKAVTGWKSKGLLVLNEDGKVDVDATEWKLDDRPANYRGGVTHRLVRAPDGNNSNGKPPPVKSEYRKPGNTSPAHAVPMDGAPDPADFDSADPNLPMAEAVRRKENFLGLLRKHEFEVEQREWVRVEDVGHTVEREYAVVRERLLSIPGKLAIKLVGLDRTAIDLALFNEISEALSELHGPASDGDGGNGATG